MTTKNVNITDPNQGIDQAERDKIPDWKPNPVKKPKFNKWILFGLIITLGVLYIITMGIMHWFSNAADQTEWLDVYIVAIIKLIPVVAIALSIIAISRAIDVSSIIRLPGDVPVLPKHVNGKTWNDVALYLSKRYFDNQDIWAANSPLRSLNQLDLSSHHSETARQKGESEDEEIETIKPIPYATWLKWLDTRAHILLAAETGAGKSTLARAILAHHIDNDARICILDPHSSDWYGLESFGGAENWQEIAEMIEGIYNEYKERLEAREVYKRESGEEMDKEDFPKLLVLFDEMNNARYALSNMKLADKRAVWEGLTEVLGSGARKVNISILGLVQSADIRDLGISAGMRNNFTIIGLDYRNIMRAIGIPEIALETRRAFIRAIAGIDYPAVAVVNGKVELLERDGLISINPSKNALLWRPIVRSSDDSENPQESPISPDNRTDGPDIVSQLLDLMVKGVKREHARKPPYNMVFQNKDWTEARKRYLSSLEEMETSELLSHLIYDV